LSEPEENLATLKSLTGAAAWTQLYDETLASIRIPLTVDGEARELTVDEARAARAHVLTHVFNTLFQDHKIETGLRKYETPIAPTLLDDELDLGIAESLMSTTERNYPLA